MPREYVPLDPTDPQPEANPEQTTSIVALTTYTFLDKYIFQAYRQGRLEFEQLPALADYDYTKNLVKRSFKHLDMFSGAPNHHMFIALMKVFCKFIHFPSNKPTPDKSFTVWEYAALTLMMIFRVLTSFLAPVGINRLLK